MPIHAWTAPPAAGLRRRIRNPRMPSTNAGDAKQNADERNQRKHAQIIRDQRAGISIRNHNIEAAVGLRRCRRRRNRRRRRTRPPVLAWNPAASNPVSPSDLTEVWRFTRLSAIHRFNCSTVIDPYSFPSAPMILYMTRLSIHRRPAGGVAGIRAHAALGFGDEI